MTINQIRIARISDETTGQVTECLDDEISETLEGLFPEPDEQVAARLAAEDYDALGVTIETISDDDMTPAQWERVYAAPYARDPHRTGDHRRLQMWGAVVTLPPSGPRRLLSVDIALDGEHVTIEPSTWLQLIKAVRGEITKRERAAALSKVEAAARTHSDAQRALQRAERARDAAIRAAREAGVSGEQIAASAHLSKQRYYQIVR